MTKEQIVKDRQAACQHEGLFTVETLHRVREESSQDIIGESRQRHCVNCGFTRGHVMGPWDSVGGPFKTSPGQNFEDAAREALKASFGR